MTVSHMINTINTIPVRSREAEQAMPASESSSTIVSLQDVAVRQGGRTIWRDASFEITPGEFVAILGPNGAGKSTLLRLLLGLLAPGEGAVRVFGRTPRRGNPAIGYVPQRRTIDPDLPVRGRDLVQLGLDGTRWGFSLPGKARQRERSLVEEALIAVEAAPYADRPIGQLSGGEQQRLLLAQALVGQPQLLLLDEPLASLDLRSQIAVSQLVARVARERKITVLLVTHDVNPLLPVVDRVLYVARGQVAIGTPDDIITTENLTRLYDAPVEVVHDSQGRVFVVGLENETAHPHSGTPAGG
ncbi:MAG TPA: ABC transporter ATP-binding protein [Ktedonobacterales bacterium]|nr:ABC transporter ATP-binding protein [Ktedonobacterales bacterium]